MLIMKHVRLQCAMRDQNTIAELLDQSGKCTATVPVQTEEFEYHHLM